jgi:MFS family permease
LYAAALPLIATSYTGNALAISSINAAGLAPWVLFGLVSGALVDRWPVKKLMWVVNFLRSAVVAVLSLLVLLGWGTIGWLAVVAFLLATGETLYGTASQSMVPAIVDRSATRLHKANSWLSAAQVLCRDFVGRPLGGVFFGVAAWLPVLLNALSFGASSALVAGIEIDDTAKPETPRRAIFAEVAAGVRWLLRHRLLRALALMVALDTLIFSSWIALLVLLAEQRFGLGPVGFAVFSGCCGGGALVGSLIASRAAEYTVTGTGSRRQDRSPS